MLVGGWWHTANLFCTNQQRRITAEVRPSHPSSAMHRTLPICWLNVPASLFLCRYWRTIIVDCKVEPLAARASSMWSPVRLAINRGPGRGRRRWHSEGYMWRMSADFLIMSDSLIDPTHHAVAAPFECNWPRVLS